MPSYLWECMRSGQSLSLCSIEGDLLVLDMGGVYGVPSQDVCAGTSLGGCESERPTRLD